MTKRNAQTPKRKRYFVKWDNVCLAIIFIFLGSYAFGILPIGKTTQQDQVSSSVVTDDIEDFSSNSKSNDTSEAPATKQVRIDLSDEEFALLVLAVQHECGISSELYLTVSERADYTYLNHQSKSNLSYDQQDKLYWLKTIARARKNRAQQLTAATMLNRIGKVGFGVEGYEYGFGKNLIDVLSQEDQYSVIDENGYVSQSLLDDISHWTELPNRNQFNPSDADTIANIKKVINGEVEVPENLVAEIRSSPYASREEAEWDLKARNSYSDYVHSYEMIPCSYEIEDEYGNRFFADFWCVYGINDTGTGFAYPLE